MKKYTYILTFLFAIICFGSMTIFAQTETLKFDDELAKDFGKGMSGDAESLEKAMKKAEASLKANPKDGQTLAWVGSATLSQSGQSFMSGNFAEGSQLWTVGRAKLDEAVSFDPENIDVLIIRGSTYLAASARFPVKEEADTLRTLGTEDLEKIITLTKGKTDEKSIGIRKNAINKFISFYEQAGNTEKAESYKKLLTEK